MKSSPLLAASALALAGCATVPRDAGFPDVERSVAERTEGKKVSWYQGGGPDREVAAQLDRLLAGELTADAAVQVALLNNRELQATYEGLAVAQADLVAAGLLSNPIFDAQIRFAEGGAGRNLDLGITQSFLEVLYLPLRKRMAAAAFAAARIRVTEEVLALTGEVRAAFVSYQAARQTLEMRRQVVTALEASLDLASRLRRAGNITELDLANEGAQFAQARVDLRAAEADVIQRREAVNALLGLWGRRTTWTAAARLPDVPAEELSSEGLERRAVERSLGLAAARFEMERAARYAGAAGSLAAFPELAVGAAAEREHDPDTGNEWSVGPSFSVPLPLFNQGRPARAAALAELRRIREKTTALAVEVRARVRAAHARAVAANERARHYAGVLLPVRQQIVDQTQLQYNAMQVGAFQLLVARQQQIDTGAAYVETLRDYWLARSELDLILNGHLPSPATDVETARSIGVLRATTTEDHE